MNKVSKGLTLELQVQEILENAGYATLKRGKGIDIIAYSHTSILFVECKNWSQNITGKTLTKIRRKLNHSVQEFLNNPLYAKIAHNKQIIKVIIASNPITIRYGDILTFTLSEFAEFIRN